MRGDPVALAALAADLRRLAAQGSGDDALAARLRGLGSTMARLRAPDELPLVPRMGPWRAPR